MECLALDFPSVRRKPRNGILQSYWLFRQSVFSYLCPRATVTLSGVAGYIPTFVAIFHEYIFEQRRRSLPQADK